MSYKRYDICCHYLVWFLPRQEWLSEEAHKSIDIGMSFYETTPYKLNEQLSKQVTLNMKTPGWLVPINVT